MTSPQRRRQQVSLSEDEQILIVKKGSSFSGRRIATRCCTGLVVLVGSLIVFGPVLLRLYGDVILTKLFFQNWCKTILFIRRTMRKRIFLSSARYYPWIDLTEPSTFGLNGINLYEQTEPNVTVGLWSVSASEEVFLNIHLGMSYHRTWKSIVNYRHSASIFDDTFNPTTNRSSCIYTVKMERGNARRVFSEESDSSI